MQLSYYCNGMDIPCHFFINQYYKVESCMFTWFTKQSEVLVNGRMCIPYSSHKGLGVLCNYCLFVNHHAFTCHIEMGVAGSLPHLVGDDTFIDPAVTVAHGANDQTVDIPV